MWSHGTDILGKEEKNTISIILPTMQRHGDRNSSLTPRHRDTWRQRCRGDIACLYYSRGPRQTDLCTSLSRAQGTLSGGNRFICTDSSLSSQRHNLCTWSWHLSNDFSTKGKDLNTWWQVIKHPLEISFSTINTGQAFYKIWFEEPEIPKKEWFLYYLKYDLNFIKIKKRGTPSTKRCSIFRPKWIFISF